MLNEPRLREIAPTHKDPLSDLHKVLGCPVAGVTVSSMKLYLMDLLENGRSGYAVAINAEKIHSYSRDPSMRGLVESALLPYPDGAAAVFGLRLLHGVIAERVDMPSMILEVCQQLDIPMAVVGATPKVHAVAVREIRRRFPSSTSSGQHMDTLTSTRLTL